MSKRRPYVPRRVAAGSKWKPSEQAELRRDAVVRCQCDGAHVRVPPMLRLLAWERVGEDA
ncbi:hypothetical protein ACUY3S_08230 [Corynebacterium resistens]